MDTDESDDLSSQTLETLEKNTSLRLTQPRKRLIKLMASVSHPMSAEEIHQASQKKLDLVTIYRNMAVFAEYSIVQLIPLENGKHLYELTPQGDHYHHIVCRECHRTERLDFCIGGELERFASKKGYLELNHMIEVYGICSACRPD